VAVRIRIDGTIVCAAMHPEEPGDTYIHDGLHYRLSVELGFLVTDECHLRADPAREDGPLDGHGLWWWKGEMPTVL
jgi:hypothetical protein